MQTGAVHVIFVISVLFLLFINCSLSGETPPSHPSPLLAASMPAESSPVVSAVLLECPKTEDRNIRNENDMKTEPCEDQLMINVRVNPSFHVEKIEKFLILDEVYDPRRQAKAKIMSPYLIEISRGEPVMMYPLEFSKSMHCENCEKDKRKRASKNKISKQYAGADPLARVISKMPDALWKSSQKSGIKDGERGHVARSEHQRNVDFKRRSGSHRSNYAVDGNDGNNGNDNALAEYGQTDTRITSPLRSTIENYDTGNGALQGPQKAVSVGKRLSPKQRRVQSSRISKDMESKSDEVAEDRGDDPIANNDGPVLVQPEHELERRRNRFRFKNRGKKNNAMKFNGKPARDKAYGNNNYSSFSDYSVAHKSVGQVGGLQDLRGGMRSCECKPKGKQFVAEDNSKYDFFEYNDMDGHDSKNGYNAMGTDKWSAADDGSSTSLGDSLSYEDDEDDEDYDHETPNKKDDFDDVPDGQYISNVKKYSQISGTIDSPPNEFEYLAHKSAQPDSHLLNRNADADGDDDTDADYDTDMNIDNQYEDFNDNDNEKGLRNDYDEFSPTEQSCNVRSPKSDGPRSPTNEIRQCISNSELITPIFKERHIDIKKAIGKGISKYIENKNKDNDDGYALIPDNEKASIDEVFNKGIQLEYPHLSKEQKFNKAGFSVLPYYGIDYNKYLKKNDKNKMMILKSLLGDAHNPDKAAETLETLGRLYKDKPSKNQNTKTEIQPSRFSPEELISKELPEYRTKRPPFAHIVSDPNLSLEDKLAVLNMVDPYDTANKKLLQQSKDNENSYKIEPIKYPAPIEPFLKKKRKSLENSKKKRSFVLYDDLFLRDTSDDNDYSATELRRSSEPISQKYHENYDPPCSSCGGKGKKPHGKGDSSELGLGNNCGCRSERTACTCSDAKLPRSTSDAWYAVFNMSAPLPFLTTKLRIYRKRHNCWWRITPSITLNSLSGIFANANLSILFSSHVDIFQLEKSLRLQDHQLVIPKNNNPMRRNTVSTSRSKNSAEIDSFDLTKLNADPSSIFAIDKDKFNGTLCSEINKAIMKRKSTEKSIYPTNLEKKENHQRSCGDTVYTIGDLGYFPTTMNLLEHCPQDENRLCLNILEDKVPAYSFKIKMPFRENSAMPPQTFLVKITSIFSDATTTDTMQVFIGVINEGVSAQMFTIGINCRTNCFNKANNVVEKILMPHIGETVTFLLPLVIEPGQKQKILKCDADVKAQIPEDSNSNKTQTKVEENKKMKQMLVATRSFSVLDDNRCLCVWECKCHCVPKLETHVEFDICKPLSMDEKRKAGLLLNGKNDFLEMSTKIKEVKESSTSASEIKYNFLEIVIFLLLLALSLGLLKAIIGLLCFTAIDKCGYDSIQPTKGYCQSSRLRRFFINTVFFFILPFLFCCKCFRPTKDDFLVSNRGWSCDNVQNRRGNPSREEYNKLTDADDDDDEDVILSQANARRKCRLFGGHEIDELVLGVNDDDDDYSENYDEFDDDEDEASTKFVLQTLVESRESLKKLLQDNQSQRISHDAVDSGDVKRTEEATKLVASLKSAKIVYRVFDRPLGNVHGIPTGVKYCLQGFFLPSLGEKYEFINYHPLAQYRSLTPDGKSFQNLRPPIYLNPEDFSNIYNDKMDVLDRADLYTQPPPDVPCINVSVLSRCAMPQESAQFYYQDNRNQQQNEESQVLSSASEDNIRHDIVDVVEPATDKNSEESL